MKHDIHNIIDHVPPAQGAEQLLSVMLRATELTWAGLIDTAFDHGQHGKKLNFSSIINCYDFPELKGLSAVAPCLVELSSGGELREQVTRLVRHCRGRPMLSFVGTKKSLSDVCSGWRSVHMVSVVDNQKMLLRFADTRILSYLPQVLTSPQWATVCGGISTWMYFNRRGQLEFSQSPDLSVSQATVSITKEQLDKLLHASRPDTLMNLIAESMFDIVPMGNLASERYSIIKGACRLVDAYGIDNSADVLALAVAAYLTKGRSNDDLRLKLLLDERAWVNGALGDAIVDAEIV